KFSTPPDQQGWLTQQQSPRRTFYHERSHLIAVLSKCTTTLGLTLSGLQIQTFRVSFIRKGFSCGSRTAAKNFDSVFAPTNEPSPRRSVWAKCKSAWATLAARICEMYVPPL